MCGNSYKIKKCLPNAHLIIKEAIKSSHDNGRPKNGMFIAVPSQLREFVTDISPEHWRVQAIIIHTEGNNIMIINTYFPNDPKTEDFDSSELLTTLSSILDLTSRNDYNSIIWTGDINADFRRNTVFTKHIQSFIDENNFCYSWNKFPVDFTHVQENNGKSFTAILDHFMWSRNLDDHITDAGVLHLVNNFSDHSPVYCQTSVKEFKRLPIKELKYVSKPSWDKASETDKINFTTQLHEELSNIEIEDGFLKCENVDCKDIRHNHICDEMLSGILESIDELSKRYLIREKSQHKMKENPIAFWKSEIEPFKQDAQFWHAIWISAGKPFNTELHKIMKRTRNIYHLQIRKCKRAADALKRNALLDACINGESNIFSEIRKMRKSPVNVINSIDEVNEDIPGHFSDIYSKLYNSGDDKVKLDSMYEIISEKISTKDITEILKITPDVVKSAVSHLKKNKTDPVLGLTSDCLLNAPSLFFEYLSIIFRSWLFHGHVTEMLLLSTLVPIIKDKMGNLCSSDNYRSIAISSLILKIFDWVLIILYGNKLNLDDLQFGYQEHCSTNMCTWMAIETIQHFMENGSEVFVCVMDLKKAFDTVKHSTLFQKLKNRGLPAVYIRLLMVMYSKQMANVRWNNEFSKIFSISNGVKQGAVLSAILFCVYIDDLFQILRRNKSGCWVNGQFCGMLGYADDIMLISPTIDGLQDMINKCSNYMTEHNLAFSTNSDAKKCKTKCMALMKKDCKLKPLSLNGNDLPWVTSSKHLGTTIDTSLNGMAKDLMEKRAIFINRNNELIQEFKFAYPETIIKTNNIFNTSMYGCVLWDLFSKEAVRLEKSWNISQRLMLGLHRETHRYFLEPISQTKHITFHLYKRFVKFINQMMGSKKKVLRILCKNTLTNCKSISGRNIRRLMLRYGAGNFKELCINIKTNQDYRPTTEDNLWKITAVKDLIDAKYDNSILPNFTNEEIDCLRDYISTC